MKKILFLGVNPVDTNRLRLDEEAREIAQALRGARKREQFDSKQSWAVTDNDLRQALLDYEPEIVHFSGHGEGEEGLKFEDETGSTRLIPPEALADLFRLCAKHVQCVILNTCYSEPQAEAIFQHISYVIGTKGAIDDAAAIRFSRGFYDALMAGRNFKEAFEFGRNAIATRNMPDYQLFVIKEKNPGESPELTSDLRFDTVTSANIVSVDSVWMDDDFERTLWGDPDADPERSATKMQREYMEFVGKIPACNELLYQVREFFSVYSKKFSYSSKPVFAYKIT